MTSIIEIKTKEDFIICLKQLSLINNWKYFISIALWTPIWAIVVLKRISQNKPYKNWFEMACGEMKHGHLWAKVPYEKNQLSWSYECEHYGCSLVNCIDSPEFTEKIRVTEAKRKLRMGEDYYPLLEPIHGNVLK